MKDFLIIISIIAASIISFTMFACISVLPLIVLLVVVKSLFF